MLGFEQLGTLGALPWASILCMVFPLRGGCDLLYFIGKIYLFILQPKYYLSSEKNLSQPLLLVITFSLCHTALPHLVCVKTLLILNCNYMFVFLLKVCFQDRGSVLFFYNSHPIHPSFVPWPLYLVQSRISVTPLIAYLINCSGEVRNKEGYDQSYKNSG